MSPRGPLISPVVFLEIAPEPPFLEADLGPVDQLRGAPRAGFGGTEWRPAGWINRAVCGGASSAQRKQSYGVQPQINRTSFAGDLGCKIVRDDIRFLVRDA